MQGNKKRHLLNTSDRTTTGLELVVPPDIHARRAIALEQVKLITLGSVVGNHVAASTLGGENAVAVGVGITVDGCR